VARYRPVWTRPAGRLPLLARATDSISELWANWDAGTSCRGRAWFDPLDARVEQVQQRCAWLPWCDPVSGVILFVPGQKPSRGSDVRADVVHGKGPCRRKQVRDFGKADAGTSSSIHRRRVGDLAHEASAVQPSEMTGTRAALQRVTGGGRTIRRNRGLLESGS